MFVACQVLCIPGEHGIAHLDCLEITENRLRRNAATCAKMPLQITDPEHQFGNGGRAGIDFKSQKLVRVDGFEFVTGEAPLSGERGQGLQNLAFEPFHQFERYIQKISGAAGRIENADVAKLFVKCLHQRGRALGVALGAFGLRRCLDIRPFGSERLQNRRYDQPLDIRAGCVVSTKFAPLGGVQGLFEKRAENRGLNEFPILRRGLVKLADFLARQGKHRAVLEQIAIELSHVPLDGVGEAPLVHRLP